MRKARNDLCASVFICGEHSRVENIYGVDFSGAKEAGRTIWIAHARSGRGRMRLVNVRNLGELCGTVERAGAMAHLRGMIGGSRSALWAMDFPFGLPVEVMERGQSWRGLLEFVGAWADGAHELGLWCVRRAERKSGRKHIYRRSDRAVRTPFSCYHYRIIHQTFHGMREILRPLVGVASVLPFAPADGRPVIVEACPSSTLKRMGLPYQNYKQIGGGALTARRRGTRRTILAALEKHVRITPGQRRVLMADKGGDALDAVIAAVGAEFAWRTLDHAALAADRRVRREGYIYA
jgi:hypothetical protein